MTEIVDGFEKEWADMTQEELEQEIRELNEMCMLMQQEEAEWERNDNYFEDDTPLTKEQEEFDEKLRGIRMRSEGWSRNEDAAADAAAAEKEYQRTGIRH